MLAMEAEVSIVRLKPNLIVPHYRLSTTFLKRLATCSCAQRIESQPVSMFSYTSCCGKPGSGQPS